MNYEEEVPSSGIWTIIPPILPPGEKEHVIYYYNESTFYAKEYSRRIYLNKGQ